MAANDCHSHGGGVSMAAPSQGRNKPHEGTEMITTGNRVTRFLWGAVWLFLFRPTPNLLHAWRRFLLRLFGARIGRGAHPYPGCRVWAPWNLVMGDHSCLANGVDCYCVATVTLGAHATVSQYSYLCSAGHDYSRASMPIVAAPIIIGERAWIAADVFVGPGVMIGDGAVILARSSVVSDIPPWTVAAGSPATPVRERQSSYE